MSQSPHNQPLPVQAPPDVQDPAWEPLLDAASQAPEMTMTDLPLPGPALRQRLFQRLTQQRGDNASMVNVRRADQHPQPLAQGVRQTLLYQAKSADALRPGEPLRALLIELAPGAVLDCSALTGKDAPGQPRCHREWLVMAGDLKADGQALSLRDYLVLPRGQPATRWSAPQGGLLFLRESDLPAQPGDQARWVLDAEAGWPEFAPGIRRRVLWQRDGQAALLYHTDAGACIPRHSHGHDEECLMLQGDLFLDDVLLRPGDYQLAPAGSVHHITETDTGVVVYAHADLDMRFSS